jgi:hypothetical protein
MNSTLPGFTVTCSPAGYFSTEARMDELKPGDHVFIKAKVLRTYIKKGQEAVSLQLPDGTHMLTTPENLQLVVDAKALQGPPEHKAMLEAPENKSRGKK